MRKLILLALMHLFVFQVNAKPKQKLYVSVLATKNYVVGRANDPSGNYKFEKDTVWTHTGWKNVRNFGISILPGKEDYIYLACGNGAMRSLDGGESWKITTDWRVTEVLDVAIYPHDPNEVFIATAYGVWRTADRGDNWHPASDGLAQNYVSTIEPDRKMKNRVIVGGEAGLHLSENGAMNWVHLEPKGVPVRDIQQNAKETKLWLVGTEDKGVLISRDNGNTWQFAEGSVADKTIYAVATDSKNPDRMAAGGFQTGVFISDDGGKDWRQFTKDIPNLDVHALCFDPDKSSRLWVGTLGAGVYFSDDMGKTWNYAGLNGAEIWDMLILED